MNAKQHRDALRLAIQMGIKTVAQYAMFALVVKQIAKEVKK